MDLAVAFIFGVGSVICHQLPDRSFFLDGRQLPICARCTGLYLSTAVGIVAWFGVRLARGWRAMPLPAPRRVIALVAVAGVPTAISFASGVLGIWDGSNLTRAVLAIPLGLAAGGALAAACTKDLR